ncbi:MAG: PIN domain-containing protein [Candidatus Woesearchaeota archaeon]
MTDEFIDSNILIYLTDLDYPDKKRKAKQIISRAVIGNEKFAISPQILGEFFVNATKKIASPISEEEGKEIIRSIIKSESFFIFPITKEITLAALEIVEKHKISYWDAQIISVMKENGISTILTENTKDFNVPGIVAVNPFK